MHPWLEGWDGYCDGHGDDVPGLWEGRLSNSCGWDDYRFFDSAVDSGGEGPG